MPSMAESHGLACNRKSMDTQSLMVSNNYIGRGGRFGRGASLYRHRLQMFERLWVRLPLPTGQFSEI